MAMTIINRVTSVVISTRCARIVGPVSYRSSAGHLETIPIGPCLVETLDGRSIDIIWGDRGQRCAAMALEAMAAAQDEGHLVLLD
jgi:hypothetical protein